MKVRIINDAEEEHISPATQHNEQHQQDVDCSDSDQQRIATLEKEVIELRERVSAIEEGIRFAAEFNRRFMDARKSLW